MSKRYGEREVLTGVDLIARPGRLHGLLGPNGAGKTTLMRVLLGLVRCDTGTVRLLGCDLDSPARPIPDGVAGSIETPAFYPYLSGRRNLTLLARLDGRNGFIESDAIADILEQVGLSAAADVAVGGYSAGMRQRLGLAASLLRRPRLLFLDEPTSSLDPAGARDVRTLARRLADEGATVVFSSHDMMEVEELCHELTVLNHGRVVFSGSVEELRKIAPTGVHALLRTSDDLAALNVASQRPGVRVQRASAADGEGLTVSAHIDALDAYVIALGCHGVAVRTLECRRPSLESLFLDLTRHVGAADAGVAASIPDGARASTMVS